MEIVVTSRDQTRAGFDSANRGATGLGSSLGKLGDLAKIAGGFIVANLVTNGLGKLTQAFDESIRAASDLGESVNAVNQIFDEAAPAIIAWGEANANALGLSRRAFQQLATPLGAMLKNSGLSMKQVEQQTIALTERAADMASVFNTDVSDALQAIQAGLRGESDPLERYGVGLSAAKVEQQALADTGKKSAAALTEQEKQLARLKILFQQTNDVAGDFRNTSDGYANSARIAAAKTEELQAQIGEKLMPIAQKATQVKLALVTVISDKVIPAFEKLSAKYGPQLREVLQEKIIPAVRAVWSWLSEKVGPILEKIATEYVAKAVTQFQSFRQTLKDNEEQLAAVREWLGKMVDFIIEKVVPVVGPVLSSTLAGAIMMIEHMIRVIGFFVRALQGIVHATIETKNWIVRTWDSVVAFFRGLPGRISAAAAGMWNGIKEAFRGAINWIVDRWNGLEFRVPGFSAFGFNVPGVTLGVPNIPRLAHGGIPPAWGGGWAELGERGREAVRLPSGSMVYSADQTRGMAERGELGGGRLELDVRASWAGGAGPSGDLGAALVKLLRLEIRTRGGDPVAVLSPAV